MQLYEYIKDFYFFEPALIEEIKSNSIVKVYNPGDELIREGQFIKSFPLVITGLIKIMRKSPDGNEILLYYLKEKEACSMSLTCCLSQTRSNIHALVEEESTVLLIKSEMLEKWMSEYPSWKHFVMKSIQSRFQELLDVIDSIAFLKLDERLEKFFYDRYKFTNNKIFQGSHQDLANHLNSSREVISRLLKKLENDGKIKLSRNFIDFSNLL